MQLLSLSCVICISGEPRRYTQRVSERNSVKAGERQRERETIRSDGERKREMSRRSRRAKGDKDRGGNTVMGEPL